MLAKRRRASPGYARDRGIGLSGFPNFFEEFILGAVHKLRWVFLIPSLPFVDRKILCPIFTSLMYLKRINSSNLSTFTNL